MSRIREKGFEGLSVREIIDRANLGRAAFYTRRMHRKFQKRFRVVDIPGPLAHALHGAGKRAHCSLFGAFGYSTSQRRVPDNLIKQWLGHSQNLLHHYAAQRQMGHVGPGR